MVKVTIIEDEPIILAALGAKLSRTSLEKGTIADILEQCRDNISDSKSLVNRVLNKSGHKILGDFLPYAIALEDLSRFAALFLWRNINTSNLIFGAGLEASLRVMKPDRYKNVVGALGKKAFDAYENAIDAGVLNQGARFILPEATLTRMIFTGPPRYLIKVANALKRSPLPELQKIAEEIHKIVETRFHLSIPNETLPSEWKFVECLEETKNTGDYLDYHGTVHSLSLGMDVKGSLSMYAQLVRQRQTLCQIEPLSMIAKTSRFVLPPSFPKQIADEYKEIAQEAKKQQKKLLEAHNSEFVYFLLLGQEAKSKIYSHGQGVIELSQARSEGVAQWEIRNNVGIPVTLLLDQEKGLRPIIGPKCWRENKCTEPTTFKKKKNVCKAFEAAKGNWRGTLPALMDLLKEPHEVFTV